MLYPGIGPCPPCPFSFRTVNLKNRVRTPRIPRGSTALGRRARRFCSTQGPHDSCQSNVILDYLARTTGHFEGPGPSRERWQRANSVLGNPDPHHRGWRVRPLRRGFRKMHDEFIAEVPPNRPERPAFVRRPAGVRNPAVPSSATILPRSPDIGCLVPRMVFNGRGPGSENRPDGRILEAWATRLQRSDARLRRLPHDLIQEEPKQGNRAVSPMRPAAALTVSPPPTSPVILRVQVRVRGGGLPTLPPLCGGGRGPRRERVGKGGG